MVKFLGLSGGDKIIEAGDGTIFYHPTDKNVENWMATDELKTEVKAILTSEWQGCE